MEPKTELQKNAIVEARRKELESFQRALDIQWLNSRMEDGRMGRCVALIQKEAEMEKDFQQRTDHAAIVNARANKETALALEIGKVRREGDRELLRRHYLRERDPSLRQLTKKLQAGYVCRDLQQQILHNEYKRLQEKAQDFASNRVILSSIRNDKEAREKEETEKMEKDRKYRLELQQQLVNRQTQRQCLYEESLIEKKMLEEIERTLADEDNRELEQKRIQTEKLRKEMVVSLNARQAWKQKQKRMLVVEERQIEEQAKAASDRSAAVVAERERKLKLKEELNKKLSDNILAEEAQRQKREGLIKLLQEQECLEKNFQDDLQGRRDAERIKRDTRESLMSQMEAKKRLAAEQRTVDEHSRRDSEAKLEAENAKEREKERKRREMSEKYSVELRQQIRDNVVRRQTDRRIADNTLNYVKETYAKWDSEVSEERKKIVQEHVPKVMGYLQAGVLTDTDLAAAQLTLGAAGVARQRHPKCNEQCRRIRDY